VSDAAGGAPSLELADWRRRVAELYATVRHDPEPEHAHETWRRGRDELFRQHPQSPLAEDDPLRESGLPYYDYAPELRFEVSLAPAPAAPRRDVDTTDGVVSFDLAGRVAIAELGFQLDVWWLGGYAGGLFLPVRDGTARTETYGGGRYLLDTVKGADLGSHDGRLVLDFNFLYHPSCRYSPDWVCPLAPEGNTTDVAIRAGERL
jgi:uncharacterized protein (DUF1684 family)